MDCLTRSKDESTRDHKILICMFHLNKSLDQEEKCHETSTLFIHMNLPLIVDSPWSHLQRPSVSTDARSPQVYSTFTPRLWDQQGCGTHTKGNGPLKVHLSMSAISTVDWSLEENEIDCIQCSTEDELYKEKRLNYNLQKKIANLEAKERLAAETKKWQPSKRKKTQMPT